MTHISTQTLKYEERTEDIAAVMEVLDMLNDFRIDDAKRRLVILHAALLAAQTPSVVPYDQRAAHI
jgi:hypothetical protein